MKACPKCLLLVSLLFVTVASFSQPLFFGFKKLDSRNEKDRSVFYKTYIGKSIIFYEPSSWIFDAESSFDLKKIKIGSTYKIIDVKDESIVVKEENSLDSEVKPVKIKCYAIEWDESDRIIHNLPCYFVEPFNKFKEKALGRKVLNDNSEYVVSNVIMKKEGPFLELSNGEKTKNVRIDAAINGCTLPHLSEVKKPLNKSIRYGDIEKKHDNIYNLLHFCYGYIDNYINVFFFTLDFKNFAIYIKNKSEYTMKIIWDDAAFVNIKGETSKIIHSGVEYAKKQDHQTPSIIVSGAEIKDVVTPSNCIEWDDGIFHPWSGIRVGRGWKTKLMYPPLKEDFEEGKKISLLLPFEIEGVINDYLFTFDLVYVDFYPELVDLASYIE